MFRERRFNRVKKDAFRKIEQLTGCDGGVPHSDPCIAQKASWLTQQGLILHRHGQLDAAVTFFKEALEQKLDWRPAYAALGHVLLEKEQYQDAIKILESAPAACSFGSSAFIDPGITFEIMFRLGLCYFAIEDNAKAKRCLLDALAEVEKPDDPKMHSVKSWMETTTGSSQQLSGSLRWQNDATAEISAIKMLIERIDGTMG